MPIEQKRISLRHRCRLVVRKFRRFGSSSSSIASSTLVALYAREERGEHCSERTDPHRPPVRRCDPAVRAGQAALLRLPTSAGRQFYFMKFGEGRSAAPYLSGSFSLFLPDGAARSDRPTWWPTSPISLLAISGLGRRWSSGDRRIGAGAARVTGSRAQLPVWRIGSTSA